jgi:ribonuclease-3
VNEHRDGGWEDNERLEFLGDAVVDLLVSHRLMDRFPAAREGQLSKMRAAVVDEVGLAAMARALGLGELLRLGRGEELTGGREKASLLADAMEAVLAAVYLDGGVEAAQSVVDRFLEEAFRQATEGTLDRDYKTQLQESCQARFRTAPRYRVVAETGPDHSKLFEVEVHVRGEPLGRGSGRSKKDAEQIAARAALEALAQGPVAADAAAGEPATGASAGEAAAEVALEDVAPEEGAAVGTEARAPDAVEAGPGPAAAEEPATVAAVPAALPGVAPVAPTAPPAPAAPAKKTPPPARRRASRKVTIAPVRRKAAARATGARKPRKGPRRGGPRKAPRR